MCRCLSQWPHCLLSGLMSYQQQWLPHHLLRLLDQLGRENQPVLWGQLFLLVLLDQ
jgi:hypothetical protein